MSEWIVSCSDLFRHLIFWASNCCCLSNNLSSSSVVYNHQDNSYSHKSHYDNSYSDNWTAKGFMFANGKNFVLQKTRDIIFCDNLVSRWLSQYYRSCGLILLALHHVLRSDVMSFSTSTIVQPIRNSSWANQSKTATSWFLCSDQDVRDQIITSLAFDKHHTLAAQSSPASLYFFCAACRHCFLLFIS